MGSASQLVLENVIRLRSSNSDPNHNMAHANCGLNGSCAALWILRSMDQRRPRRYEEAEGSGER
jgi:hypothetical protein